MKSSQRLKKSLKDLQKTWRLKVLKAKDEGELETSAQHSVLNHELYECAVDMCENNDKWLLALSFCFLSKPQTSFWSPESGL